MKKAIYAVGGAGLALCALSVLLAAPGRATERQSAPFAGRCFAHRGLHEKDHSVPENSLRAFDRACEAGYGIELDVQLTRDGQVVVFHDDTLDRVCGVSGRVDSFSYAELQAFPLWSGSQRIPLFSSVLDTVAGRVPLIVELKMGRHNRELCEKTYAMLSAYRGDACIESFHPGIVRWFRRHAPELLRGQLAMPPERYALPRVGAFFAGNCLTNFLCRPHFIAYELGRKPFFVRQEEKMGALRVCWTSRSPVEPKAHDAVIFEFYRPNPEF